MNGIYATPVMEIMEFENEDIITTSNPSSYYEPIDLPPVQIK